MTEPQGDEEVGPAEEEGEAAVTESQVASNVESERGQEVEEAGDKGH